MKINIKPIEQGIFSRLPRFIAKTEKQLGVLRAEESAITSKIDAGLMSREAFELQIEKRVDYQKILHKNLELQFLFGRLKKNMNIK